MWKEHKKTFILTCMVMLLPMVAGVTLWDKLPQQMATHFDAKGEVNGWSSRGFVVFGMPLILLALQILMVCINLSDPKKKNLNGKLFTLILWMMPMVSLFVHVATYAYALEYDISIMKGCELFLGLVFLIIGNYLPKCKQNYTLGYRLSWALNDEDNWNKTHRLAGFLWVLGGAVIMLSALWETQVIMIVVMVVLFVVPVGYSFIQYKKLSEHSEEE